LARSYSKAGSFLQIAQSFRERSASSSRFEGSAYGIGDKYVVKINNRPNRAIKLGKKFDITLEEDEDAARLKTTFKSAKFSMTLSSTSYNSKHNFGVLQHLEVNDLKLAKMSFSHADWGTKLKAVGIPAKTHTLDLLVVVTPTDGQKSWFYRKMISIDFPRLGMGCGKQARNAQKDLTISCKVQFYNPLPYAVENAVMSFTISGQTSVVEQALEKDNASKKVAIAGAASQSVDTDSQTMSSANNGPSTFAATFTLKGALGSQIIIAKLTSSQISGVSGTSEIVITPNTYYML
jgi:hypothetical protein